MTEDSMDEIKELRGKTIEVAYLANNNRVWLLFDDGSSINFRFGISVDAGASSEEGATR